MTNNTVSKLVGSIFTVSVSLSAACSGPTTNETGVDGGTSTSADARASSSDAHVAAKNAIPLTSPDGSFYTANLLIGAQSFALDLDTGSSTTGIASSGCSSCSSAGVTDLYTPSSTATTMHNTAQAQYGDGSGWSGDIYADQVGLANGTPNVPLNLVAITQQDGFFQDSSYDGILGLGPDELLEQGTSSYIEAVSTAGVKPLMAFELCAQTGTMWLGDFDTAAAVEAPQFTPSQESNNNPFYAVDLNDIAIDGVSLGFGSSTFQQPIVDTGTSLWYAPQQVITALTNKVNASSGFASLFAGQSLSENNCQQAPAGTSLAAVNAALPKMSLGFPKASGGKFSISVDATSSYLMPSGGDQYCLGVFDDQGSGGIMGDSILRAFVTVIDTQNSVIGFGADQGCAAVDAERRAHSPAMHKPVEHGRGPRRVK